MSGGGAGKVYFVLYLAVVLELLIIIVERDEAEEHLHAKQKEAMKIVQSILSQMQTGAGSEGVNTKPQDEITITPPGVDLKKVMGADIKPWRRYIVEVGVTDVTSAAKIREGESKKHHSERLKKLVELANVEELELQIFYNNSDDPDFPPEFPSEEFIEENKWDFQKLEVGQNITTKSESESWKFLGIRKLTLDPEKTFDGLNKDKPEEDMFNPIYNDTIIGKEYAPDRHPEDSVFYYSILESIRAGRSEHFPDISTDDMSGDMLKRSFVVFFQPPAEAGWYKLRVQSKTNKILGLRLGDNPDNLDKDASVNIGTVQLKVKQLIKVKQELEVDIGTLDLPTQELFKEKGSKYFEHEMGEVMKRAKDKYPEEFSELKTKITLYGYILRLLTPGMSKYFKPNQGAIDFNIRVITPKPDTPEPKIFMFKEFAGFDEANVHFNFKVDPYKEGQSNIIGYVYNKGDEEGSPVAEIQFELLPDQIEGRSKDFIGTVKQKLEAGGGGPREYVLKMTHRLGAEENTSKADLTIFPTIVPQEIANLEQEIAVFAEYGGSLIFNHIPPSGNKILPEQFGFYFSTDADSQPRGLIRGYTAERSDKLEFPAEANKTTFKLVWIDPITGEETAIVPEKEYDIAQASPKKPNTSNQTAYFFGEDDFIDIEVSGIKLDLTSIPDGAPDAKVNVTVTGKVTSVDVTEGYEADGDPEISMDPDGNITINLAIVGEPDEDGFAIGTVKVKLFFVATNPINGKSSTKISKTINININHEFTE